MVDQTLMGVMCPSLIFSCQQRLGHSISHYDGGLGQILKLEGGKNILEIKYVFILTHHSL